MRSRFPGPVMSPGIADSKQFCHGWVKVNAAQTIDNSFGVASITDVSVGVLDVTWATAFGSEEYGIAGSTWTDGANASFHKISQTVVPTSTVVRFAVVNSLGTLVDPFGWFVASYGI